MFEPETEEHFRNATPNVHDHTVVVRPGYGTPTPQVHVVPVHAPTYPSYTPQVHYPPAPYQPAPYPQYPHPVPAYGQAGPVGCGPGHPYMSIYQKHQQAKVLKTIGVVVDVLGQAIAAFMPVPGAPTILGVSATDDENMKRYQQALANHAKTDERIRTVAKVVREALDTVKGL